MPDHVARGEIHGGYARNGLEYPERVAQAALAVGGKVHLRDVPGNDGARIGAEPRQEHLHLLRRRVLPLIEDDEAAVERSAAHIGQRRHLDHGPFHPARDTLRAQHRMQGVVYRPQVGIHLAGQIAGQEAQPLPGLHRRTHQNNALDVSRPVGLKRAGHRQPGLPGPGGTDAEGEVARTNLLYVAALIGAARTHADPWRDDHRL